MNISQAAAQVGLSAKQIRDYEKAGLLPLNRRTEAGYRFYHENDLARLSFISNARKVGFSLAEIGELLKLQDNPHRTRQAVKQLTEQHIDELEQKIADLQAMLALLQRWNQQCCGDNAPDCPILIGLEQGK